MTLAPVVFGPLKIIVTGQSTFVQLDGGAQLVLV
jgi:hypothetical protein